MKRSTCVFAVVLSLAPVVGAADRLQDLSTGAARLARSVAEGQAPQPGDPSQPTTGDQAGPEGKRTQLLAERAALTAQIAAYNDELRRMQAEAAAARERATDAAGQRLWSAGGANAGSAQGLYQTIQALIHQRLEAQRRLIHIDQELDPRQGLSTGTARTDQRVAQSRTAEPPPPSQQPGPPPSSAEPPPPPPPRQPPPFTPIPPEISPLPKSPADRAGERGVMRLHALKGEALQQYQTSKPDPETNRQIKSQIKSWEYSGHPEDSGGSLCLPPGWVAHYSPDHLVLRLTSPDGSVSAERGFMGDPRRGLREPISEEMVANLALQRYNIRIPNGRILKEDKWESRFERSTSGAGYGYGGSNLRLEQVPRTACRGAPLQDKFGRVTPPEARAVIFLSGPSRDRKSSYLVRTIFRALQAGEYTVAVLAESFTIAFSEPEEFFGRSIHDYHLSSYVAVIAPADQFTALTEDVFIPLLQLLWFSWEHHR
jgi:hypothetical protein